jgi:hypothetical protein
LHDYVQFEESPLPPDNDLGSLSAFPGVTSSKYVRIGHISLVCPNDLHSGLSCGWVFSQQLPSVKLDRQLSPSRPHPPTKMGIYAPLFEARREEVHPEALIELPAVHTPPCSCCRTAPALSCMERRLVLLEPHVGHLDLPVNFTAIPGEALL